MSGSISSIVEIEGDKTAVKFFSGVIIGFCRLRLVSERAEVSLPAVFFDIGNPFAPAAVQRNALVFRCGSGGGTAVDVVLSDSTVAKVGPAIIQAVVIDMVTDQM